MAQVIRLEKNVVSFLVEVSSGEIHYAHSIIVASGKNAATFETLIERDHEGFIKINSYCHTCVPGIFAAGGVCSPAEDLVVTAAEGIKAVFAAEKFLKQKNRLT